MVSAVGAPRGASRTMLERGEGQCSAFFACTTGFGEGDRGGHLALAVKASLQV